MGKEMFLLTLGYLVPFYLIYYFDLEELSGTFEVNNTNQPKRLLLTRTGINIGQQFQMWPQPVEVSWVSGPLQSNRQLLDTLSKRSRGLQLRR